MKPMILILMFLFFTGAFLSAMGGKPIYKPMKTSSIKVEDGEFVRMGTYSGGDKISENYVVTRIIRNKKTAEIYWQVVDLKSKQNLPSAYTNYNTYRAEIDLETGGLISSYYQNSKTNEKGLIRSSFILDKDQSVIRSVYETWDGNDMKISRYKTPVKKDYPVFDESTIFSGVRFLDITGPGMVYMCQPNSLKDPMPVSYKLIGKEIIHTPAGDFKTIKVSLNILDPFLSKLAQPFTAEVFVWIEDSPRMLLIKSAYPGGGSVLEEISTIKEKGMEQ